MALQGTLDTFALPDVLRLLASTKKSGRLVVRDQRGEGSLWVDAGEIVGSDVNGIRGRSGELVLLDLLRFADGSFTFEPGAVCPSPDAPAEMEPVLVRAEALFAEWQEIAAVVPSSQAWVTLAAELPTPTVSIEQGSWCTIVSIGVGTTVGRLAETLDLGELDASRMVFELVNLGLATVEAEAPYSEPEYQAPVVELAPLSLPEPESVLPQRVPFDPFSEPPALIDLDAPAPAVEPEVPSYAVEEPAAIDDAAKPMFEPSSSYEPVALVEPEPASAPLPPPPVAPAASDSEPRFDMAAQLATLSPKAAAAVAAAAGVADEPADASEADRDDTSGVADAEARGEGDDGDEPINRGLLLKFLSSVKS